MKKKKETIKSQTKKSGNSIIKSKKPGLTQQEKSKFRSTKTWTNFRTEILTEKDYVCDCCLRKLPSSKLNLHHRDLNSENYTNISDKTHFSLLCSNCHDTAHSFYSILINKKNKNKNVNIYNLIRTFFIFPEEVINYFKFLENK